MVWWSWRWNCSLATSCSWWVTAGHWGHSLLRGLLESSLASWNLVSLDPFPAQFTTGRAGNSSFVLGLGTW